MNGLQALMMLYTLQDCLFERRGRGAGDVATAAAGVAAPLRVRLCQRPRRLLRHQPHPLRLRLRALLLRMRRRHPRGAMGCNSIT